ncbi:MAG: response regulator [Chthoniobacteraceae bacterium]
MSQPLHKLDYDSASKRDARAGAPLAMPPPTGAGGNPTEQIRRLSEQLVLLGRDRDDARAKLAEAQKKATSLRQARDTSQAHSRESTDKIQHLTDQLAELSHERDEARKLSGGAAELRRRCDEILVERDQLAQRIETTSRDLEMHRTQSGEATQALAKAREEIIKLTQEREAARARAQEKVHELDELRAALQTARAEAAAGDMNSPERDALSDSVKTLDAERARLAAQVAEFEPQLAAVSRSRDEALVSLAAAQKQIDHIGRERDQQRQQAIKRSLEIEDALAATRERLSGQDARLAEAEKRAAAAEREKEKAIEKSRHVDKERLAAIDIAAQLDAARREIRRLTADLAETRLGAMSSTPRAARAKTPPPLPTAMPASTPSAGPPTQAELDAEALSEKEARGLLAEIKRCHTTFAKAPTDFSLLNELHCHVQHFAERSRVSGFLALHRLSHAFAELAQDLYRFPEQVNPSTLRTISQTIDLLGILLKQKNYARLKDPTQAKVFAVEDDAENCDAIRMALETVFMRTRYSQEPAIALAELGSDHYDLIFLDVALPDMNGFELCKHIRELPNHAHTPVVFLTGLTTMENRVQSSLSGANDFIGKPFNLHELGVKAISLVLKASLHIE